MYKYLSELDSLNDIIAEFKLNHPLIREKHKKNPNHKVVKIAYGKDSKLTDCDYSYDEDLFVDPNKKEKIMVRVPFSVTIKTKDKYSILGLNEDFGYRLYLENIDTGIVNHMCNVSDIHEDKRDVDDHGDYHQLDLTFPYKWNNVLHIKNIEEPGTYQDIYSQIAINVKSRALKYPIVVTLSVRSNGDEFDKYNIRTPKIYMQWG